MVPLKHKEDGSIICLLRAISLHVHCLSSPFNTCVNLGKLTNLSVPHFFHLRNTDNFITNFKALLYRLNELMCKSTGNTRTLSVFVKRTAFHRRKQAQNLTAYGIHERQYIKMVFISNFIQYNICSIQIKH